MRNDEARMTFTEHLAELRTRIIRSGVALLVAVFACYAFHDFLFYLVARPLLPHQISQEELDEQKAQEELAEDLSVLIPIYMQPFSSRPGAFLTVSYQWNVQDDEEAVPAERELQWVALNPVESIIVAIKLSVYGGVLISFPFILYQILAFVFPGLKPNERKAVQFVIFGGAGLAVLGVSLAYFGILPLVLPYLTAFTPENVATNLRMSETVSLILMFYLGFAISFQFPMIVMVLVYLELLSPETLKKYRGISAIGIAIVSAILTPADPISMVLMAIPLWFLYELSIWASYLLVYNKKKRAAEAASSR